MSAALEALAAVEDALDAPGERDTEALSEMLVNAYQALWDERGTSPSLVTGQDDDDLRFEVCAAILFA